MEAVGSTKTLVSIYQTVWTKIPEGKYLQDKLYSKIRNLKKEFKTRMFSFPLDS
jgi:hypothetical protein